MFYIQTDFENRIIAYIEAEENPDNGIWIDSPWQEIPEDFSDWLYINKELIYNPRDLPLTPFSPEQVLSAIIQETTVLDSLPDSALMYMAPYMSKWDGNSYEYIVDDKVQYDERAYRCIQSHTSQLSWNPKDAPSLWAKILAISPDIIPEWEQPDSTNPYNKGDHVTHIGKTWESLIDGNIWEPGAIGTESLWIEII